MRVLIAALATAALVLGGLLAAASPAEAPVRASASAFVVAGTVQATGVASTTGNGRRSREVLFVEQPGLKVVHGEAGARSALNGAAPTARATAVARTVSILDGLVTAYGVRRTVTADGAGLRRTGRVDGLFIDGRRYGDIADAAVFDLPDHSGRVVVNTGATGLRVVLARASYGQPAGTDIRIAVVKAEAGVVEAAPADDQEADDEPVERPAKQARPAKAKRRKAPNVRRRLTSKGFAFPVYGNAAIADDWGAPRQIGAHQGNDIFAPFGAPVLAVADGIIEKVGTLPISGNRLWLRSEGGDEFFYAHLSAFSPAAVNGRSVKAGTVLGFTGNTGDAEPTPPHVHFEIHPGGGDAIDPHEILLAWQGRRDVPPGAWLQRYGADTAARPGALVEVRDFIAGE